MGNERRRAQHARILAAAGRGRDRDGRLVMSQGRHGNEVHLPTFRLALLQHGSGTLVGRMNTIISTATPITIQREVHFRGLILTQQTNEVPK